MIHSWRGQKKYMLNEYKILTVTHKHVRLERIGDFLIPHSNDEGLQTKLDELKDRFNLEELLYVATCNRVIYLYKSAKELNLPFLEGFFHDLLMALVPP